MTDNRTTELRRCKYCGEKPQVLKMDGRAAHACRVLDRELRMTVDEWNVENEDATEKPRTVEDALADFLDEWRRFYYHCEGAAYTTEKEIAAKYADELRDMLGSDAR